MKRNGPQKWIQEMFPRFAFLQCCLAEYEIGIKSSVDENVDSGKAKYGVRGGKIFILFKSILFETISSLSEENPAWTRKKNKNSANVFEFENCDIKIYMPEKSTPNTIAQMALPCINKEVGEFSSKICQIFIFTFFAGFYLWKVSVRLLSLTKTLGA